MGVSWRIAGSWTSALLWLNVASFILQCYRPDWEAEGVLTEDTLVTPGSSHRLITSSFLHVSWWHLGANMYSLWLILGSSLATSLSALWGKRRRGGRGGDQLPSA